MITNLDLGMQDFYLLSWVLSLLYIWFDTDAFIHWAKLLRLKFIYKGFELAQKNNFQIIDWITFLESHQDSFILSLISCPYCLSVWIVLFLAVIFKITLIKIGFYILCSWVGYSILKFLLDKLNA